MDISPHTSPAPGSIVIGIDGSDGSNLALRWGAEQARLERRPLALVAAAADRIVTGAGEPALDVPGILEAIHDDCEALLATAVASLPADDDLVVHTHVAPGDARQVLIDLSKQAATIVLGSRGRGPVASLLLGSVSVGVTTHAHCPVVVVRPDDGAAAGGGRVLIGVCHGRSVGHAAEFGFRQASLHGLPLTVVHGPWQALYGYDGLGASFAVDSTAAEDEADAVGRVADLRAKFPDVAVSYEPAPGLPDAYLVAAAHSDDVIVVGTRHPGLATTILDGDVARWTTEHAHGVVAVVPES
ncbi:MAG: UspA domain protein [Nocardioidaceae bacterium]|nr:UspA domain protein [Nocardioidaceae bacterium]